MMVLFSLIGFALAAGAGPAAAAPSLFERAAIPSSNETISSFVTSLNLTQDQSNAVRDRLVKDTNFDAYLQNQTYDKSRLDAASCETLQLVLGKASVNPPPVDKNIVQRSWSQTAWLTPSCVASPENKDQVAQTIKTVNLFKSRFSVRSGGHSPNPGFSILQGEGLLIDLRKINHITVSSDSKTVALGPGARWGTVYAKLDGYNVGVLGARIPTVGVGGAFLGGGYFHFSGQFGMAADNLNSIEVVLADGRIVEASATKNSDLFWAIKGGGPNYGIVTNYKANTVPVKDMWYSVGQYATSEVPAILDAFAKWQTTGASDVKATVALIIGLEATTLGFFYSEPATKPASFDVFDGLTPLAPVFTTNGTVQSLTEMLGGIAAPGALRHDYRAASSKVDAQLYKDVYAFWKEKAEAVHKSTGANMTFTLQPVPPNLAQQGAKNGGNPMGAPKEAHQWWTTLVDWARAEDDEAVRAVPIATEKKWVELSKARGLHVPYLFMNDASRDQNPLASYGAANLRRMRTVAKKYDPSEVFQKLQNGGFLLSKA